MPERLDYIVAIVEEQNITRAARRLFITQPALTKYINKLEEEYGIILFDRKSSPITLTEAGRVFLEEKTRIEIAEQNLRHRLEALKSGSVTITIGIGHDRAPRWIPKLLQEFCRRYPDINLMIKGAGELSLPDKLRSGEIDAAIGVFESNEENVEWRYLTVEKLSLVVPLAYGIFPEDFLPEESVDRPYILKPEQLNGLDYISPAITMGAYDSYQALRQLYSINVGRQITTTSARSIRTMIIHGLGYGYGFIGSVSDLQDENGVFRAGCCILPGLPTRRFTRAAYHSDHIHVGLLRELTDMLEQQIINADSPSRIYWKNYQNDDSLFV